MVIILMMKILSIRNKKMGKYHVLYLKTDDLFLAEVFQKFKNIRIEYYGLDSCHYFSSPALH